jgi:ubiquinone/menaquinone biosynthesis C-methylase UbiE
MLRTKLYPIEIEYLGGNMPGSTLPSAELFFATANAHQQSAALRAAVDLNVFTAIGRDRLTSSEIAAKCECAEKGIRVLCDYLTVLGFLTKDGSHYSSTPDTGFFLDRNSPAYLGGTLKFLNSPMLTDGFKDLTETVRKGGTTLEQGGTVAPEHPIWKEFAKAMAPMMRYPAQAISEIVASEGRTPKKVLDIAAGHGVFGITIAQNNPSAKISALDWPAVLEVAKENAKAAGVSDRYSVIPGSAFDVNFGDGYDLVLLTNFLHHFSSQTNEQLLGKIHKALADGGMVITLEFVPNEDRISPRIPASFALMMLGSTAQGDAYTFTELEQMFRNAGFSKSVNRPIPPVVQNVVVSYK